MLGVIHTPRVYSVPLLIDYKTANTLYGLDENKALHLTLISKANTHISQKSLVFLGETLSVPKHLLPASSSAGVCNWEQAALGCFLWKCVLILAPAPNTESNITVLD